MVLTGPPGAGKSTAGPAVARALGRPFVDLDACVEREARASVAELFAREGEQGFRARERDAFETALARGDGPVIAAGGGALLERSFRLRVLRDAWVITLRAPAKTLAERIALEAHSRPLLRAGDPERALTLLLEAREGAYAECHAAVDAAGHPEAVALEICGTVRDLERDEALAVPLGVRTHLVRFAPLENLHALLPDASLRVLVADARVARSARVVSGLRALDARATVRVPGVGDRAKTLAGLERIWRAALEAGADRDALVIALGGGVVTDLAGFAAATLLRGVRYASVPTTVLAMADASVGGKTGIDYGPGKNLVGAFHQPSLVLCDPTVLATLPARRVREGVSEIVKVALACDAELLAELEAAARGMYTPGGITPALVRAVRGAIRAKIDVVSRDEREGAARAVLNFGHTLGHAIEHGAGYAIAHGECVALGMRGELRLGVALGITPPSLAARGEALMDALGLARRPARRVDRRAAHAALGSDKKRQGETLRFVVCDAPGSARLAAVPRARAARALSDLLEIG